MLLMYCILVSFSYVQANDLDYIRTVKNDKNIQPAEKEATIRKYVETLEFKDLVSIGNSLAIESGVNWYEDVSYTEVAHTLFGAFFKGKEIPFQQLVDEVQNKERHPAWRSFVLSVSFEHTQTQPTSDLARYFENMKEIALDTTENSYLRSNVILCFTNLLKNNALKNKTSETIEILLQILNDPSQNEIVLRTTIRSLRSIYQWRLKENVSKEFIRNNITALEKKWQAYPDSIKVEIAEMLVYTFGDTSILPQLREMEKSTDVKILKWQIKELIRNIESGKTFPLAPPTPPVKSAP